MHIRRTYLNAIKAQLKTIPDFSKRTYNQRTPPRNQYPCVTLYAVNEETTALTINATPRPQERVLAFHVSVFIKATQDEEKLEADIDAYTAQVEAVVKAPTGTDDLQLVQTQFPEVFQDEEKLEVAEIVLTYALHYTTTEFNPV